jgi:hypothetical protein
MLAPLKVFNSIASGIADVPVFASTLYTTDLHP